MGGEGFRISDLLRSLEWARKKSHFGRRRGADEGLVAERRWTFAPGPAERDRGLEEHIISRCVAAQDLAPLRGANFLSHANPRFPRPASRGSVTGGKDRPSLRDASHPGIRHDMRRHRRRPGRDALATGETPRLRSRRGCYKERSKSELRTPNSEIRNPKYLLRELSPLFVVNPFGARWTTSAKWS
jgi:hypothetical protein